MNDLKLAAAVLGTFVLSASGARAYGAKTAAPAAPDCFKEGVVKAAYKVRVDKSKISPKDLAQLQEFFKDGEIHQIPVATKDDGKTMTADLFPSEEIAGYLEGRHVGMIKDCVEGRMNDIAAYPGVALSCIPKKK
jgi:hypothetical protein